MIRRRSRLARGVVIAALLAPAACGGGGAGGESLPDLEVPALVGDASLQLDELEGPAVVNLWATWCAPCRRELPDFQAVADETAGEVRFVGVNIGDDPDDAAAFIDELGITFDQYLDLDGELTAALGTATLPVTLVIDADGAVRTEHVGPMDQDDLRQALADAEAPAA